MKCRKGEEGKSDAKIKESGRASKEKRRKEEREEAKKAKSSKKDDKDDHVSGVAMSQDHVRRGKVFQYGKESNSPVGRGTFASAPCYSDLSDTDVPDDDGLLDGVGRMSGDREGARAEGHLEQRQSV